MAKVKSKDVAALQEKVDELVSQIKNSQTIKNIKDNKPLSERIVELGLVKKEVVAKVLKMYSIEIGGRLCQLSHPDKPKMMSHLAQISKLLSANTKKHLGVYPPIKRQTRSNAYFDADFKVHGGDQIIEDYFKSNPYKSWKIDERWSL